MKKQSGFTLIELMIVLALMAIVAGIAVPNFNSMIANSRLTVTNNNLAAALGIARSEAIRRAEPVQVVAIVVGGNQDWNNGWRVEVTGSAEVIREFPGPRGDIVIAAGGGVNTIVFSGLNIVTPAQFDLSDDHGKTTQVRCVGVAANGRVASNNAACP